MSLLSSPPQSPATETDPLLPPGAPKSSNPSSPPDISDPLQGAALSVGEASARDGETFDNVPRAKRQLGLLSAIILICNRVIGSGIYATPSVILRTSGSVGVTLLMWLLGALIAAAGTAVYVELGTGLPRSGGEKNYLEFMYRRPKFLISCVYTIYALVMGSAASNSIVLGEYTIHSLSLTPTTFNTRFVAFLVLTFTLVMHGMLLEWGRRLQNTLGLFKLVVLSVVAMSGILCLLGTPGFGLREGHERPRNFEWDKLWEGSGTGANGFVTALYNVTWTFVGYSNANYALSEVRNPVRTIKRAAPLAMLAVTVVYMLINVAYFAVVSKADILGSRRIIAALFFRNLYGATTEKILSAVIALSTLGNILAGQYSQGRVVQELGREGILPYSSIFASSKPFNAPLSGLFAQYVVSMIFVMAPPPGDAYLFLVNVSSYSLAIVNTLVSAGLLLLHTRGYQCWKWNPPFQAPKAVVVSFFISNLSLLVVPLIPPAPGTRVYEHLPYWLHVSVSASVSMVGVLYWFVSCVLLPERRGYRLERRWVLQEDGVTRFVFEKMPIARSI